MARKSKMTNDDIINSDETPEVVVETASVEVEERPISEQTRLEMEAGRKALAANAASARAE